MAHGALGNRRVLQWQVFEEPLLSDIHYTVKLSHVRRTITSIKQLIWQWVAQQLLSLVVYPYKGRVGSVRSRYLELVAAFLP